MKGIILAGGAGTRLHPATLSTNKHLLSVYDKPMVYYPLTTLIQLGLTDIIVITTPRDCDAFRNLLGDGRQWGLRISYAVQARPEGIAQAFIVAEAFIGGDDVCLMLGDNVIYAPELSSALSSSLDPHRAKVFAYRVRDPQHYGVVSFDAYGTAIGIEEKPATPKSNYAVVGLYFYTNQVVAVAKNLKPSARGELEITDVNRHFLAERTLGVERLGRGVAWLDTGTHDSLLQASHYISVLEQRQGLKIGCPEEAAWRKGLIDTAQLQTLAAALSKNDYGRYLLEIVDEGHPN